MISGAVRATTGSSSWASTKDHSWTLDRRRDSILLPSLPPPPTPWRTSTRSSLLAKLSLAQFTTSIYVIIHRTKEHPRKKHTWHLGFLFVVQPLIKCIFAYTAHSKLNRSTDYIKKLKYATVITHFITGYTSRNLVSYVSRKYFWMPLRSTVKVMNNPINQSTNQPYCERSQQLCRTHSCFPYKRNAVDKRSREDMTMIHHTHYYIHLVHSPRTFTSHIHLSECTDPFIITKHS